MSKKMSKNINQNARQLEKMGDEHAKKAESATAIEYYKKILAIEPDNAPICVKIAECLRELDFIDLAIDFTKEAININPQYSRSYLLLGNIYDRNLNDLLSAIEYFKKYTQIDPKNHKIYNIIGNLYKQTDIYKYRFEQIEYYKKAVELKPDFVGAVRNLAIAYSLTENHTKDAIKWYERVFEIGPMPDDYYACACELLKSGDFERGWKYYESRFENYYARIAYPKTDKPMWKGENIKDKTLLVNYEQGFGDSIQFLRYVELLKPLASKIILRVQKELVDLFKGSLEGVEVVSAQKNLKELDFDYHVAIMSLPHLLKTKIDNIPFTQGYIKADKKKVEKFKKEFFDNDCFKIGICWSGLLSGNQLRNIPLETFYPLAKMKNVKVYSCQKGDGTEQLENLPKGVEIIDLGNKFNDFSDTAAAIENVDLFIGSDNGVFNLAAAMGKKTFLLLNKRSEWRWMFDEEKTPWYKSVRIFKKQKEEDSWDSLMNRALSQIDEIKASSA